MADVVPSSGRSDQRSERPRFRFVPAVLGIAFAAIGALALVPDITDDGATAWAVVLAALGGAGIIASLGSLLQNRSD